MADEGIKFFPLQCHTNDSLCRIESEYGIKGFAIIVRLWQKIYAEKGYYCEWPEDGAVLFLTKWFVGNSGADPNFINEVVEKAIYRGIFNKDMYDRFGILTSEGIQERFFEIARRRKEINAYEEYLLLSDDKIPSNVNILSKNVCIFDENVAKRKVKESKEKEINILCKSQAEDLFNVLWQQYPNKKGKGQVSMSAKLRLLDIGQEEMHRAIDRYKTELKKDADWRKPQNGSTFFNSGYVDYLDANYVPSEDNKKKGSSFNNFNQRNYDMDEIERQLLRRKEGYQ